MFIYSLPILFSHMQLGTPLELALITLFLYGILFIVTPSALAPQNTAKEHPPTQGFYQYLRLAWTGELELRVVFWPFFIILNLALFAVDTLSKQGNFTVSSWDDIHLIFITPVIFWSIVVWRNSINSKSRYWSTGARLVTIAVFFEYGLKLIIRMDYPRIFFSCQELMLDYANCF